MVVVKFLVFVSEVVSIFSKILTRIIGGAKGYLCPTSSIIGGRVRAPAAPLSLRYMLPIRKIRSPKVGLRICETRSPHVGLPINPGSLGLGVRKSDSQSEKLGIRMSYDS